MILYFNKNGQLLESLDYGSAPRVGDTLFSIFAYFEDLDDYSEYNTAMIRLRKPDIQGSEYPDMFMVQSTLDYDAQIGGSSTYFKTENNPYNGFLFDFNSVSSNGTIVRLLDTPGMWEASITLYKSEDSSYVTGLVRFYVEGAVSGGDDDLYDPDISVIISNIRNLLINDYVPYSGANDDLNLNGYSLSALKGKFGSNMSDEYAEIDGNSIKYKNSETSEEQTLHFNSASAQDNSGVIATREFVVDYVGEHTGEDEIFEMTSASMNLTEEQYVYLCQANARIKYGEYYYEKAKETSTEYRFQPSIYDIATINSEYDEITKKVIVLVKATRVLSAGTYAINFYNKTEADEKLNSLKNYTDTNFVKFDVNGNIDVKNKALISSDEDGLTLKSTNENEFNFIAKSSGADKTFYLNVTKIGNGAIRMYIPSTGGIFATQEWVGNQGYLTEHQSLAGYATETWVENKGYLTSSALSGYATQTWVSQQGYATPSDLSSYAKLRDMTQDILAGDIRIANSNQYDEYLKVGPSDWALYIYRDKIVKEVDGVDNVYNFDATDSGGTATLATREWVASQGYLTQHQSLSGYATETWVENKGYAQASSCVPYTGATSNVNLNNWMLQAGGITLQKDNSQGANIKIYAGITNQSSGYAQLLVTDDYSANGVLKLADNMGSVTTYANDSITVMDSQYKISFPSVIQQNEVFAVQSELPKKGLIATFSTGSFANGGSNYSISNIAVSNFISGSDMIVITWDNCFALCPLPQSGAGRVCAAMWNANGESQIIRMKYELKDSNTKLDISLQSGFTPPSNHTAYVFCYKLIS